MPICNTRNRNISSDFAASRRKRSEKCSIPSVPHGASLADLPNYRGQTNFYSPSCTAVNDFVIARDWREYRSLAHIAMTYKISEPTVWRTIRRVENTLVRSGKFSLPGKKTTKNFETIWQFLAIDTTETPIERPKKTAQILQRQKEVS